MTFETLFENSVKTYLETYYEKNNYKEIWNDAIRLYNKFYECEPNLDRSNVRRVN